MANISVTSLPILKSVSQEGHRSICDSLMRYAEFLGFGNIHIKVDKATGLKAIVAIHNLKRGPAIGGCRFVHYPSVDFAIEDALRLAYMMSYKAAINNLPHGGGKSVLIKPKVIKNREAYFEKFGEFIEELGGRYITAVDSGTSPLEMDIIARKTRFVTCTTTHASKEGSDPSPLTALGTRLGIEAAVKFKLHRDSLEGIHVAIQGAGHVGYCLAKELKTLGAILTMTDINEKALKRCIDEFGVNTCLPEQIYDIAADVFSPCAMGAILTRNTINRLKVKMIAGCANNQLAHQHYGTLIHERDILYAPDFLINAGGLIHVAVLYDGGNVVKSRQQIEAMRHILLDIFKRAKERDCSPNDIAIEIARERLK